MTSHLHTGKQHTTPSREELEVLNRLKSLPEFQPYRDYLARKRDGARDRCETLSGDQLYRAQGVAQCLKDLQQEMEQASATLQKITSSRP